MKGRNNQVGNKLVTALIGLIFDVIGLPLKPELTQQHHQQNIFLINKLIVVRFYVCDIPLISEQNLRYESI